MKAVQKENLYIVIKGAVYLIATLALIFISNFWIGTKEDWNEIARNEFVLALITRTVFLSVIGLIFLSASYLMSFVFKKRNDFSRDLKILILFSLLLNLFRMLVY